MPYRRLPNTDQARLRALKTALEVCAVVQPVDLKFSQKTALDIQAFTPLFEQSVMQYLDSRNLQVRYVKMLAEAARNARLYLSHYIQVFNFCIIRGEMRPEMRQMMSIDADDAAVPDISTDALLLEWCEKVIGAEEKRTGNRIYNPSIAVVKVKYEQFREAYHQHKDLLATTLKHHDKLDEMRKRADELIMTLWNEVEAAYAPVDSDAKRDLCAAYGLIYVYRPHEKHKNLFA